MRSNMGIIRVMVRAAADISPTPRSLRAVPAAFTLLACLLAGCAGERANDSADADAPGGAVVRDTSGAAPVRDTARDGEPDDPGAAGGAEWTAADTRVDRSVTGSALLRELRTARHEGFDRIVLEFEGDVPGYRVAYVDRPVRQCGSGDVVPLAGDAWLSITVEPADAHTEAGEATVRERERAPGLPALLELKLICDFEAVVEVVAGVAAPGRYRAFVLTGPGRLVVDIMHPSS